MAAGLPLLLAAVVTPALAAEVDFSGAFTGDEAQSVAWEGACADVSTLAWQTAGAFRLQTAGDFALADAGELVATDVQMGIYDGAFQPANPSVNRLARLDGGGVVTLSAGRDYELVVQRQCTGATGVWAVRLSGPGAITAAQAQEAPAWAAGTVNANGPTADFGEGPTPFRNVGLFRVDIAGFYSLADVSVYTGLDTVAHIYGGAFQSGNASANRIARIDDGGRVWLEANVDYRLVVSAYQPGDHGDYRLTLFPPGATAINEGLSGAWFEPATSGQGVLLEVYPDLGLLFLAWFTFDVAAPFNPDEATLGDASQRWLTGVGAYEPGDDQVELSVSNTTGGLFDQAAPGQDQDNAYGTFTLIFHACDRATLEYDLPDAGVMGAVPLSRLANDNVEVCGNLLSGPGIIGQ